jgi:CRP-like cAMP-binding protein
MSEVYDFLLDNIETKDYNSDQYIIREGQQGTHLYILEKGQAEVLIVGGSLRKKENLVKEIGPGTIFGEISLLYETLRTASVRAKDNCTVGTLSQEIFH